ncbi:MAG TPA: SDR family NAD(P)-dependent oxidoreductase [Gemmatimonadaceae bacterium]|nr:SDR family NAD(P)-dependent oxidoreductase [Gemmatimonadaceae bacterium]
MSTTTTPARPVALVTGASRGIGRAIARRLAEKYAIIAVARSAKHLQTLAAEIAREGGECRTVPLDITDPGAVQHALGAQRVDVLVNNAGVGYLKPLLETTPDEWREMVDVNFNALYHVTRAVLRGMIERRNGFIVNIASLASRNTFAGGSCYAATKHAMLAFGECLMLEVRQNGVRVATIMPGSVATDFRPPGRDTTWMLSCEDVANAVWYVVTQPDAALSSRVELRPAIPKAGG